MVADYDKFAQRNYVRPAARVTLSMNLTSKAQFASSSDLQGKNYPDVCPYFDSCTTSNNYQCVGDDSVFTFAGRVGVVTEVINSLEAPAVFVTFNGGRTAYKFAQENVVLEYKQKSMYGKNNNMIYIKRITYIILYNILLIFHY